MIKRLILQGSRQVEFIPLRIYPRDASTGVRLSREPLVRESAYLGQVRIDGDFTNGAIDLSVTPTYPTCSFTVTAATMTRENVIYLGNYRLLPYMNYTPVAGNVNDTATAIAAAISLLPGFTATANVATVTVTWNDGINDVVDFRIVESAASCFSSVTPSDGTMTVTRNWTVAVS